MKGVVTMTEEAEEIVEIEALMRRLDDAQARLDSALARANSELELLDMEEITIGTTRIELEDAKEEVEAIAAHLMSRIMAPTQPRRSWRISCSNFTDDGGCTMSQRRRLPNRRPSERLTFEHDGIKATVTVGYRWPGFEPAEVFLHCAKVGSAVEAEARDGGIAVSIALQHGASLDELRHSLTKTDDGKAASILGAALDAVAR